MSVKTHEWSDPGTTFRDLFYLRRINSCCKDRFFLHEGMHRQVHRSILEEGIKCIIMQCMHKDILVAFQRYSC